MITRDSIQAMSDMFSVLEKGAALPIGTVNEWSTGRHKKVAPGDWRPVSEGRGSGSSIELSGVNELSREKTEAPRDLGRILAPSQVRQGLSPLVTKVNDAEVMDTLDPVVFQQIGSLVNMRDEIAVAGKEQPGISEEESPESKWWASEIQESGEEWKYHTRTYTYERGTIAVKRNHNVLKIQVSQGNPEKPESLREIIKFKIRDRRFDGTLDADRTPLTDWRYSGRDDEDGKNGVELSIYSRNPKTFYGDLYPGDKDFGNFLKDPFEVMTGGYKPEPTEDDHKNFLEYWKKAFSQAGLPKKEGKHDLRSRFPAQYAAPLKGAAETFVKKAEAISKKFGFKYSDAVPSWWNVVKFLEKGGYNYTNSDDRKQVQSIERSLDELRDKRVRSGEEPLTRTQEAWVVLLQYIKPHLIPEEFNLGASMPLSPEHNLWMRREI